jgi:hypothetical protein
MMSVVLYLMVEICQSEEILVKRHLYGSPFLQELEHGANNEGYWTYESMVLQLEDCVDCLKPYSPNLIFIFIF